MVSGSGLTNKAGHAGIMPRRCSSGNALAVTQYRPVVATLFASARELSRDQGHVSGLSARRRNASGRAVQRFLAVTGQDTVQPVMLKLFTQDQLADGIVFRDQYLQARTSSAAGSNDVLRAAPPWARRTAW